MAFTVGYRVTAGRQFILFIAILAILVHSDQLGNCGVDLSRVPGAPNAAYFSFRRGSEEVIDLEDQLLELESRKQYNELWRACRHGDGFECRTFGISQWNFTFLSVLGVDHQSVRGTPCPEDRAAWPASKCSFREGVYCQKIAGKIRIVGVRGEFSRRSIQAWARLPYLFGIDVRDFIDEDFSDLALPSSLRIVEGASDPAGWTKLTALMRVQGKVNSVFVRGRQNVLRWDPFDMSQLCGLDLVRFTGYVVDVVGSGIPSCWSKMTNLQSFYCTNCMLAKPPTALRGLQSLHSFIAFRQREMVPCALTELPKDPRSCKPSWETKHAFKPGGLRDSTGDWRDFQEGPSFLCPDAAYTFPFSEILDLGWSNIRKVWLDGNFLTGDIPERIADVWPSLQSLDLYDNSMNGTIPESLGRLDLVKLQLQSNNFSGEVPKNVIALAALGRNMMLGLSENLRLRGCMPDGYRLAAGTQLTRCVDEL